MSIRIARKIRVRWLAAVTLVLAFAVVTMEQAYAQQAEAPNTPQPTAPDLAGQYRASIEAHRAEIGAYQDSIERIDDAIRALRRKLAEENRRGRAQDLRFRLQQLEERRSSLGERIETVRDAVSSADHPEEAFHNLLRQELIRQQEHRRNELDELDRRIATLESELAEQPAGKVAQRNLRAQIDELTRKREELARQPEIRPDDLADEDTLQETAARSFREREAARRVELASVRERIARLERSLKQENRRGREKSIETQIEELKMKEHELDVSSVSGTRNGVDEPLEIIKRGLKAEQLQRARQIEVLERKAAQLREQLRAENRYARRKTLQLQIGELEQQKKRAGRPEQVSLPPTTGFSGAPYGNAWDLDYEYQMQE